MEEDLALLISRKYIGDLVTSDDQDITGFVINVKRINSLMVLIQFRYKGQGISFRAMLSRQKEGILLRVQEKIIGDHILKGVSGFLYGKPTIHGGFLDQLNGFYFHISKCFLNSDEQNIYFLGKTYRHEIQHEPKAILSQVTSL